MNRKRFIKCAALLLGSIPMLGRVAQAAHIIPFDEVDSLETTRERASIYRVAPLPGVGYGAGFRKLCRYGRFASAEEAIASVRDPRIEFLVVCE